MNGIELLTNGISIEEWSVIINSLIGITSVKIRQAFALFRMVGDDKGLSNLYHHSR